MATSEGGAAGLTAANAAIAANVAGAADAAEGQIGGPASAARPARPRRSRTGGASQRFVNEPGFVLHTWPYKETSLIIDVLTRSHGRVGLVAKGAKRPGSALRGILQGFVPLSLTWSRNMSRSGELGALIRAEWQGGIAPLRGEALLCGFYLNELLLKLLARDDAHEALFDAYLEALARLATGLDMAPTLRGFEAVLLREAGYGLQLEVCTRGLPVEPEGRYRYQPEHGPFALGTRASVGDDAGPVVSGKTLLDIAAADYSDPRSLAEGKLLMRHVLQHHLGGQTLYTRQMIKDLQNL